MSTTLVERRARANTSINCIVRPDFSGPAILDHITSHCTDRTASTNLVCVPSSVHSAGSPHRPVSGFIRLIIRLYEIEAHEHFRCLTERTGSDHGDKECTTLKHQPCRSIGGLPFEATGSAGSDSARFGTRRSPGLCSSRSLCCSRSVRATPGLGARASGPAISTGGDRGAGRADRALSRLAVIANPNGVDLSARSRACRPLGENA
ncbi:hypothetical protein AWB67_07225 [Caballeronia terrestris]|uniref:Uncharacterized protein n=1 Tax=Caballeronia terrestris TaxID=1226301 RepID=A0A158KZY9_9BURK|nr:hypothetical protein AWB67_07225 [Caballeronia terrestris]